MSPKQLSNTSLDHNCIVQHCSVSMQFGVAIPVAYTMSNIFIFNFLGNASKIVPTVSNPDTFC